VRRGAQRRCAARRISPHATARSGDSSWLWRMDRVRASKPTTSAGGTTDRAKVKHDEETQSHVSREHRFDRPPWVRFGCNELAETALTRFRLEKSDEVDRLLTKRCAARGGGGCSSSTPPSQQSIAQAADPGRNTPSPHAVNGTGAGSVDSSSGKSSADAASLPTGNKVPPSDATQIETALAAPCPALGAGLPGLIAACVLSVFARIRRRRHRLDDACAERGNLYRRC
jgi:hypothetical protein